MQQSITETSSKSSGRPARDWVKILAKYRDPDGFRSVVELGVTLVAFVVLWVAAWMAMSISYWLTLVIAIPAGAFLVRLFLVQHDCGHAAFFKSRRVNDWVGRSLGVITLTPYAVWRKAHAIHHGSTGNLDERGLGDIDTLTIDEYKALSKFERLKYRLYRNPITLFVIGPAYLFLLDNRMPPKQFRNERQYWVSAMGTNFSILVVASIIIYLIGLVPFLLVLLPTVAIAASLGVWMFYVQHQFEDAVWEHKEDWNLHEAALHGSSFYDLPRWMAWLTGNIGVHHVHHLYSKIAFYRLPQVLRDYPELVSAHRITLMESFATVKLRLWDEKNKKLVSFATAGV